MSLIKRGRFWHYEFQYRGKRYRGSTGETSKGAAREHENRIRLEAKLGRHAADITLREAAVSWWVLHAKFLKSADNINEGLRVCDRLLDMDLNISELTTHHLVEAVARRRGEVTQFGKHPSNATINREIPYNIRPILNHAVQVLGVTDAPSIAWRQVVLRKPKPRPRNFSQSEMNAIRAALPTFLRPLLDFYILYGVRWQEAFFPLSRLDIEGRRIHLRERKGGDWHTIPITEETARQLAAAKTRAEAAGLDTVWIREGALGLEAIPPETFQRAMIKVIKQLGIKDARAVHDLRHHAAMDAMRRSGGNIAAVGTLLGHESIQTTQIYAHATEDDVRGILTESPQNPHNQEFENEKKQRNQGGE